MQKAVKKFICFLQLHVGPAGQWLTGTL